MTKPMSAHAMSNSVRVKPASSRGTAQNRRMSVPRSHLAEKIDLAELAQIATAGHWSITDADADSFTDQGCHAGAPASPRTIGVGRRPGVRSGSADGAALTIRPGRADVAGLAELGRGARRQRRPRRPRPVEVDERDGLELLQPLLSKEDGDGFVPPGRDTGRGELEARRHRRETNDDDQRRNQNLGQREPGLIPAVRVHWTVTLPVAVTTTLRDRPVWGSVTVNVAVGAALPKLVNVAVAPPPICRLFESRITPLLSVPGPAHCTPAQLTRCSVTAAAVTWTQTAVLRVTASARARAKTVANSWAPAFTVEVCQYLSRFGTDSTDSTPMRPIAAIMSVRLNPRSSDGRIAMTPLILKVSGSPVEGHGACVQPRCQRLPSEKTRT